MFSLQALLGLPLFLLLFGTQSSILLGHRSSGILWTCPYHISLFIFIVSKMSLFLCVLLLISPFLTFSNLDTPHARLQKSISKAFSRFSFLLFISHVSEPYVTMLSNIVEKIIFFVFIVILSFHSTEFSLPIAFLPWVILLSISSLLVPSFVIITPRYLNRTQSRMVLEPITISFPSLPIISCSVFS